MKNTTQWIDIEAWTHPLPNRIASGRTALLYISNAFVWMVGFIESQLVFSLLSFLLFTLLSILSALTTHPTYLFNSLLTTSSKFHCDSFLHLPRSSWGNHPKSVRVLLLTLLSRNHDNTPPSLFDRLLHWMASILEKSVAVKQAMLQQRAPMTTTYLPRSCLNGTMLLPSSILTPKWVSTTLSYLKRWVSVLASCTIALGRCWLCYYVRYRYIWSRASCQTKGTKHVLSCNQGLKEGRNCSSEASRTYQQRTTSSFSSQLSFHCSIVSSLYRNSNNAC